MCNKFYMFFLIGRFIKLSKKTPLECPKWVSPGKAKLTAMCQFCNDVMKRDNMRVKTLRKHIKYEEHLKVSVISDTQWNILKCPFYYKGPFVPKSATNQKEVIPKIVPSSKIKKLEILLSVQSFVSHVSHSIVNNFSRSI